MDSRYPSIYRERYGKSLMQISRETGLGYATVYKILAKGQQPYSVKVARTIAGAIGMSVGDFLDFGQRGYLPRVDI